jgi:hypothetical protein
MNSGCLPLTRDPKDFTHTALFGAATPTEFPKSLNRERRAVKNQGSSLSCTAQAVAAASEYQENLPFSAAWQWAQICKALGTYVPSGADPRTAMETARRLGSLPLHRARYAFPNDDAQVIGNWDNWGPELFVDAEPFRKAAYVRIDNNPVFDTFDDIRYALLQGRDRNEVVLAFGTWYHEWAQPFVPASYESFAGYHAYLFIDWIEKAGTPYLVAQNSYGETLADQGFHYFPRGVINREFSKWGTGLYIFKDLTPEMIAAAKDIGPLGELVRSIIRAWELLAFYARGYA